VTRIPELLLEPCDCGHGLGSHGPHSEFDGKCSQCECGGYERRLHRCPSLRSLRQRVEQFDRTKGEYPPTVTIPTRLAVVLLEAFDEGLE